MAELVCKIARETCDGQGKGGEREGEVVGFVRKGAAESIFDAAKEELLADWPTRDKERCALSNCLVDDLTSVPLGSEKDSPFIVQNFQL